MVMNEIEKGSKSDEGKDLPHRSEGSSRIRGYSELQLFFLLRQERLLGIRSVMANSTDWWVKLLNKAIYSTYCDCIELGVGADARSLFKRDQQNNPTVNNS
jgi:hypothetical protein